MKYMKSILILSSFACISLAVTTNPQQSAFTTLITQALVSHIRYFTKTSHTPKEKIDEFIQLYPQEIREESGTIYLRGEFLLNHSYDVGNHGEFHKKSQPSTPVGLLREAFKKAMKQKIVINDPARPIEIDPHTKCYQYTRHDGKETWAKCETTTSTEALEEYVKLAQEAQK